MTIRDFIEFAIDDCIDGYVYDMTLEANVFEGKLRDVPDGIKDEEIMSWEIVDGKLGLDIESGMEEEG